MLELYTNIKNLRKEKRMSQEDLAKAVGYSSRSMISMIENGQLSITEEQIMKFAAVFDVTPQFLMGWEGSDQGFDAGRQAAREYKNPNSLTNKINRLTPDQRKSVEQYVDFLLTQH